MKSSFLQPFFLKYNMHNRIRNGVLEKNLVNFFSNFMVEGDYEPFYVATDNTIFIDWCNKETMFNVIVNENSILLMKNGMVKVCTDETCHVNDFIKVWMS